MITQKMKMFRNLKRALATGASLSVGLLLLSLCSAQTASAQDKVPLKLTLPAPAFKGTPKDIQTNAYTEPYPDKPRPPFMVPPGLKNVAQGAKVASSDKNATAE